MEDRMARPTQRLRAERLQIMLDGEELVALDDFRFKRRMPRAGRRQCANCSNGDWQPKGFCRRRLVRNHPSMAWLAKRLRDANNTSVRTIPPFADIPLTKFP